MENSLFNDKTIQKIIENIKPNTQQKTSAKLWLDLIEKGELMKEKRGYFKFYDIILKGILGYDKLEHEKENVEFTYEKDEKSIIRIEAKGMEVKDLFAKQKRANPESPVEQLWRYMNLYATPYGIVTNYKVFILFKYSVGRSKYHLFDFESIKENPDKLAEFIAIFSKESIDNEFVEQIYEKSIIEEREFTKEFYKLFHETRLMMIKEFEGNSEISRDASVHFAQLFLNRLMFIFFAEDTDKLDAKTIENRILKMLERNQDLFSDQSKFISDLIVNLFNELDKGNPPVIFGFNGGLFNHPIPPKIFFKDFRNDSFFKESRQHFKLKKEISLNEKEKLVFDKFKNKLNPIIENILLMASFDFNTEVNVNILGHIFEQSISDLEGLKGKEDSRRKKEGIFYTPEYVTDYICRNTIIPYLSKSGTNDINQLLEEYSDNIQELEDKFKSIKILDPACGSGAFLIKAIDIMLEIHKEIQLFKQNKREYTSTKKGKKISKKEIGKNLTILKWNEQDEIREIIENNIYGVDINEESVEITNLSLFFKIARKNKKLIDLSENIKQGNSLIEDKEITGNLAFDWYDKEKGFGKIMNKGGFDVIIGNPPYGAKLNNKEVNFVKKKYIVGNSETAQLMMERAYNLLKNGGYHGFIIPKAFTFVSNWSKIRRNFLDELSIVIDCKKVWKEVKLEQIIYTIQKGKKLKNYKSGIRENQIIKVIANVDKLILPKFGGILLNSLTDDEIKIGSKVKEIKNTLNDIGINKWGDVFYKQINQDKKGFKVLGGLEIQRYFINGIKGYIEDKYIKTEQSLIKPNSVLLQRIIAHIENPIDHLKITGTIFENSDYRIVNTVHQVILEKDVSNRYVLSIMNSNFMNWCVYRFVFAKAIRSFQFSGDVAKKIPIPKISPEEQKSFIEKADLMLKLNKEFYEKKDKFLRLIKNEYNLNKLSKKLDKFYKLDFDNFVKQLGIKKLSMDKKSELIDFFDKNKKEIFDLKEKIDKTDNEINEMVYDLYGLTKEEINIIKKSS